jgi:hypothetical protein
MGFGADLLANHVRNSAVLLLGHLRRYNPALNLVLPTSALTILSTSLALRHDILAQSSSVGRLGSA